MNQRRKRRSTKSHETTRTASLFTSGDPCRLSFLWPSPLTLVLAVLLAFAAPASGQRRSQRTPPRRPAVVDYSRFLHTTTKHKQACNTCHKIPTRNWEKASAYPDIVDYPDHVACVSCHRAQFFRGARPVICTVCHTTVSPRADARLAFRNPKHPRQFTIEFPHDRHQDVIAANRPTAGSVVFRRVSFIADQPEKNYNNCTICHEPLLNFNLPPANGWLDRYAPDALTFKTVPRDHAACFSCHYKAQAPTRDECNGCHRLGDSEPMFPLLPRRISMKFKHDGGGEKRNHVAECSTCHINITKARTVRGLKPDVPITSCTECHNKTGLRLDVLGELAKIDKDRNFVCTYCHTSDVGRRDAPASHYLISERPPMTRSEVK